MSNHWFVNLVVSIFRQVPFTIAHSVKSEITIIPGQGPNYLWYSINLWYALIINKQSNESSTWAVTLKPAWVAAYFSSADQSAYSARLA